MDTILEHPNTGNSRHVLRELLSRCGRVLMEPTRFFRFDFPAMDTPSLLAFGVGNAWAASILAFFVQTINSLLLSQLLESWMRRLVASEDGISVWSLSGKSFLFSSALTLLGPFLFLLQAVIGGFTLFLFARMLIESREQAPEPVTYEGALRIRAASLVAEWYSLVPVFGFLLAFLARVILSVTGVRERFGVSTRRATAVVLAPYFVALLFAMVFGALVLFLVSQLGLQELLDLEPGQLGL